MPKKTHMLIILDGWGIGADEPTNAVLMAHTPFLDRLQSSYPSTQLRCSGRDVGLPEGIMGNSEVGHMNIGAGRVVYQNLVRIDKAIEEGSFFENEAFGAIMDAVAARGTALHLMGLLSDGGVHSQLTHLLALLDMAQQKGLSRVFVHAILDGRDTPPDSGVNYLKQLQDHIQAIGNGAVASVCGRYYAMDRDKRWDRVEKAYRLYCEGHGRVETDPVAAVKSAYNRDETDEFVQPVVMVDESGKPVGTVTDGDGIIFFNFRADRAREITRAFTEKKFDGFERLVVPALSGYTTMTLYDEGLHLPMAFGPVHLEMILGEVLSRQGLCQLRIAETEKYAHVTYFFNGGEETPFENEERCLIPSPRDVATYDQKPEMSAYQVADEVVARLDSDKYDFIVLNFANMDMVGHSGVMAAAVKACETVDRCLEKVVNKLWEKDGLALVTADHGNSEKMAGPDGKPFTAHTTNPVRLLLLDNSRKGVRLQEGRLGDIAPTLLELMGLEKPAQMTAQSLLRT
ncbi:2,3-bisphosphoglycerate-independent phosphoglycerate mutase [Desulfosarcina sp.]|uniref:2,3-bisphosphoglycerate-independent phosphoglycerate mutase n=1 Tax=Desulfosarcina sp. TaxID=2027861 RepID=UPI0029AFA70D|nr:2,3-bisphosphoglycerate-independent phosphoglycerate mutase [Desulfosarcina sp.]MDX2451044.1 2,3-bisphosphoglycerate-independent phosphoglycerate mutase [Desulfosarcina sp.]MDX2488871.1 2,3-bisphosphoglycerate-independent phosphoglycerate mutase [Desulfosarcina sp.]